MWKLGLVQEGHLSPHEVLSVSRSIFINCLLLYSKANT